MALTNNYVLITSAGLFEIGDSTIPKFNLAFSMPIYDYRIDSSILPQSGINSVIALSASVNYGDRYENIIGEKLAGDTASYSLSPEYNAIDYPTSASISGTSAINLHQILPSSINLYNGLPIKNNNITLGSIISGTTYPDIAVNNDKTVFSYVSAPTLIQTSAYTDPLSAIDTSTQTSALYPVTCYNPAYTSDNGITFIDGTFHFTIGKPNSGASFKYNKVAIFIQPSNQDDSPKTNKLPVLFAYVVYSTPITISTQTPTMDTQVQLKFAGANASLTLTVNSNDWAVVPSYMNEEGTNYLTGQYFYGDVAIGTSGIGQTWDPLAKLSLTDQTGRPQLALSNDYGHDKTTMHQYKNGVLHIQTSANVSSTTDGNSPNWSYSSQTSSLPDKVGTYIFGNLESTIINPDTKSSLIFSNRMYNTSASVVPNPALTPTISLRNSVVFGSLSTTSGDNNFLYVPYTSESPEGSGGVVGSVSGSNNVVFGPCANSSMALSGSNNFVHFSNISNSPGTLTTINDSILFGKGQTVTSAISYSNIVSLGYGGYFNNINNSNLMLTDGGNNIYNISASDIHALAGGNTVSGCNLSKLNLAGGSEIIKVVDRLNFTTLNSNGGTSVLSAANSDLLFYSGPQVSAVCYSNIHDLAGNTTYRGAYKSHANGFGNSFNTINSFATSEFVPMSIRECNIYGDENTITVSTTVTANPGFAGTPTGTKAYTSTLIGWSNNINATGEINTSGNTVLGYNNALSVFNIANHILGTQNALSKNYNSSIVGNYNILTSANGVHIHGNSNTYAYVSTNSTTIGNGNYNSYCTNSLNIGNDSFIRNATIGEEYYNASYTVSNSINVGVGNYIDAVYSPISDSYNFGSDNTNNISRRMNLGFDLVTNINTNDYFTNVGLVTIGRSNDYTALTSSVSGFQSIIEFGNGGPNFGESNIKSTILRLGSYFTTNTTKPFGSITGGFGVTSGNTDVVMFDDILTLKGGVFSPASIQLPNGSKCIIYADITNTELVTSISSHNLKIRFIDA